ncbi:MAG TPA: hypothetical protein VF476_11690 [Chitinophagaceae bacterium]
MESEVTGLKRELKRVSNLLYKQQQPEEKKPFLVRPKEVYAATIWSNREHLRQAKNRGYIIQVQVKKGERVSTFYDLESVRSEFKRNSLQISEKY